MSNSDRLVLLWTEKYERKTYFVVRALFFHGEPGLKFSLLVAGSFSLVSNVIQLLSIMCQGFPDMISINTACKKPF